MILIALMESNLFLKNQIFRKGQAQVSFTRTVTDHLFREVSGDENKI